MGYNLKMFIRETLSKLTGKKELKWAVYLCKQQSAYTLSYKLIFPYIVLSIILRLRSSQCSSR